MLNKCLHLCAVAIVGVASCSLAQETPTFKSQTNLVLVPVQVRSHGKHVAGLTQDKFTLLEDGKPQKIAMFEEVRTSTQRLKRVPVGPQQFTNRFEGDPSAARYTVIAIDRINTTTMDMQRLRSGLMKFLTEVADSGEPIRLVTIEASRISVLQDFTTDPHVLAEALERSATPAGKVHQDSTALNETLQDFEVGLNAELSGAADPAAAAARVAVGLKQLDNMKEMEQDTIAFQQRSTRINSLEALQMLAQSLEGLPGRKSVVWASSGYPFAINVREGRPAMSMNFSQVIEAGNLDEYTMHLLNTANIALYPVDLRGTVNTAWDVMDPSHKYSPSYSEKESAQANDQEVRATFNHLADATGGEPCVERTDVSGCFKDALDDAREYYTVGFYVDPNTKPGWHKLQVKVQEDANVRSRAGFIYAKLDPKEVRTDDMRLQLNSYLVDPGIPFVGSWDIKDSKGAKRAIAFQLKIMPHTNLVSADDPHLDVEIAAVARARDGSVAGQFYQHIDRQLPPEAISLIDSSGIDYKNAMALAPGDYLVRVVVRDNPTGRMGSATTLVKIP